MPPEPAVAAKAPMRLQSMGWGRPEKLKNPTNVFHQWAAGTKATLTAIRNRKTTPSIVQAKYSSIRSMVPPKDRMSTTTRSSADRDPSLRGLVRRARHPPHPGREQRRRRAPGQGRPPELEEADDGVEARPEASARAQAHDPAVDGLAGVERVADALQVEEDLEHDGDGGDEEDVGAVFDRGRRPHQPLAAADRRGGHDRARPDDLHGVADAEGQAARAAPRCPRPAAPRDRAAARGRPSATARLRRRRKRSWRGVYSQARVRSILRPSRCAE